MRVLAGLFLIALFAVEFTSGQVVALDSCSTNLLLTPISAAPIYYLAEDGKYSHQLQPAVYQTRPYDIIFIVPERGLDDGCLGGGAGTRIESRMPILHPNVQALPAMPAKK